MPAGAAHRHAGARWCTAGRSPSSATCTGTRPGCGTSTAPTRDGRLVYVKATHRARRRRVRLHHSGRWSAQRGHARHRPVRGAERRDGRLRRPHQQPAVRGDARLRRGAGLLRVRVADGQAGRGARAGPGGVPGPQRAVARATCADRAGGGRAGAGGRAAAAGAAPPPAAVRGGRRASCPAGYGNTTHGEGVRRGVGYGVGIKNVCFSEGFDDYSTARVRLEVVGGEPAGRWCTPPPPRSARAWSRVQAQIARTELGVETGDHRDRGHRGRQRRLLLGVAADVHDRRRGPGRLRGGPGAGARAAWPDRPDVRLAGGQGPRRRRRSWPTWSTCSATRPIEETVAVAAPADHPAGPADRAGRRARAVRVRARTGRSSTSTSSSGLVKVVEIATAQDVGKAMNPQARRGPDPRRHRAGPRAGADGGDPGRRRADPQPVVHRLPDPHHPRHAADADRGAGDWPTRTRRTGCAGSGEPPTISSTPAIVAAIRAATGRPLTRVPVRPEHIVG